MRIILNGIGKLNSVLKQQMCADRRDDDVLLNSLEDDLHTRVALLLKTKLKSILPPYMLREWGSLLKFAFWFY